MPSERPTRGRKFDATPAVLGFLEQVDKIRSGYLNHAFSGAHKWAEVLRNPYIIGGPRTTPPNQKWLPQRCLLGGPQMAGSAAQPLHSRAPPNKGAKIRSGSMNPTFSGAHKCTEVLRNPCILGGLRTRGQYQK